MGSGKVPDSDRYETDSNLRQILPFLCTYTLPTHEHSAPLQLFLQSLAKELPSVIQQNQLFSVLQFGARIGFILIDIVFLGASDRYQTDTKCNMKTGAAWIFGVGASDQYKTDSHL